MTFTRDREVMRERRFSQRQAEDESFAIHIEGAIAHVREEVACDVVTLLREYARSRDVETRGRLFQAFEYLHLLLRVMP